MNANARLWVEALRSGKYKQQTRRLLHDEHGYCCLGVACELFALTNNIHITADGDHITYDGYSVSLPDRVCEWLGLNEDEGSFWDADNESQCLSNLNDHGMSFTEIADIIESEPEGLFA